MAAVLPCGEPSALSHLAAAELCRVSRWPEAIAVVTATQCRPKGVEAHPRSARCHVVPGHPDHDDPAHAHRPRGHDDAAPARVDHPRGRVRNRFNEQAIRRALARANGRKGVKRVERAVELHLSGSAGTHSQAEDDFLATMPDADLVRVNTKIEVDVLYPEAGKVVEIDGHGHDRPPTRREDEERDARLTRAGYDVSRRRSRRAG